MECSDDSRFFITSLSMKTPKSSSPVISDTSFEQTSYLSFCVRQVSVSMIFNGYFLFVSNLTKRACIFHGTESSASRMSFRCLVKLALTFDNFGFKPLGTRSMQEPRSRLFVWSTKTLLRVVSGSGSTPTDTHGSNHPCLWCQLSAAGLTRVTSCSGVHSSCRGLLQPTLSRLLCPAMQLTPTVTSEHMSGRPRN